MSTGEPAFCLISWYPHHLNRELEVPPERCPMSLPLFAFSIIITMNFLEYVDMTATCALGGNPWTNE